MKTLKKNELIDEVLAYASACVIEASPSSRKQRTSEYNNIVNFINIFDKMEIDTISLDFNEMVNLGDVLKVAYLKHLHPNQKNFKIERCESVENNNQKTTKVLTCCKSRACKVPNYPRYDLVKYLIFTPTVKGIALVDFDKVVDIPKCSVGYIVANAKSFEPLEF